MTRIRIDGSKIDRVIATSAEYLYKIEEETITPSFYGRWIRREKEQYNQFYIDENGERKEHVDCSWNIEVEGVVYSRARIAVATEYSSTLIFLKHQKHRESIILARITEAMMGKSTVVIDLQEGEFV